MGVGGQRLLVAGAAPASSAAVPATTTAITAAPVAAAATFPAAATVATATFAATTTVATATTAAIAATAATAATAAIATATTPAAATTAALALAGFIDAQLPAFHIVAVETRDRGLGVGLGHLDEREPPEPPGLPVVDQTHGIDSTVLREQRTDRLFVGGIRQIAYVYPGHDGYP